MLRILIVLLLINVSGDINAQTSAFKGKKISFLSLDSLEITADLYEIENSKAPYIILFHQANFSRGAYRNIAPVLNDLGYNCLAVDLRSGHKAQGIINETCKRAIAANKKIRFTNAIQDAEASLKYVKNSLNAESIIVWGSSFSASIAIYLGSKYANEIDALLVFSPGEYFKIESKPISSFAANIKCPVFITSGKNEQKKWIDIYENITSQKYFFLPESGGAHGSKALWEEKKGNQAYWVAVKSFLKTIDGKE